MFIDLNQNISSENNKWLDAVFTAKRGMRFQVNKAAPTECSIETLRKRRPSNTDSTSSSSSSEKKNEAKRPPLTPDYLASLFK
jgi:hypothetical protein